MSNQTTTPAPAPADQTVNPAPADQTVNPAPADQTVNPAPVAKKEEVAKAEKTWGEVWKSMSTGKKCIVVGGAVGVAVLGAYAGSKLMPQSSAPQGAGYCC